MYGVVKYEVSMSSKMVNIKILFGSFVGVCILWLSACAGDGLFRDRINDYKNVTASPSLQIPRGIAAEPRSDDYYIPERDGQSFRSCD